MDDVWILYSSALKLCKICVDKFLEFIPSEYLAFNGDDFLRGLCRSVAMLSKRNKGEFGVRV